MLKIGITGGIGSGKTTVCRMFEILGIPVFYADDSARWLMEHDAGLAAQIRALLGEEAYTTDGKLNRPFVASRVFSGGGMLEKLNALTHPAVIAYGKAWMEKQQSPYAIKEAALFFESGSNGEMDLMIGVSAPLELRISRTIRRNGTSREDVLSRISRQMDQEEKMSRCDRVIENDDRQSVIRQVLELHKQFMYQS